MIGYLKIIMVRWWRNPVGIQTLVGATGAPLAFSAAAYWVFVDYRPGTSEPAVLQFHKTIAISAVLFASLAAAFALVHLMTYTIHIEKQKNRIRLLRTSGLDAVQAVLSYLAAAVLASTILAPLTMVGTWILGSVTDISQIRPTLVVANLAMVALLGPLVISSRMMLPQAFALAASYSAAFMITIFHTAQLADQSFSASPAYLLGLGLIWALASLLLLLAAYRDHRGRSRMWA